MSSQTSLLSVFNNKIKGMSIVLFIAGTVVLALAFSDLLVTTLSSQGAGIITHRVNHYFSSFLKFICGHNPRNKFLNYSGLYIMTTILLSWIVLIWAGNSLLFLADYDSVINNSTKVTASTVDKIYFIGYTLSSLGYGDFVPNGNGWKLYTSFISFTGIMYLTIAITYIVPVVSKAIEEKSLSIMISTLGNSPQEILINNWDGKKFKGLSSLFQSLSSMIVQHGQSHLSYPILNYLHNSDKRKSIAINIANLDEALTLLHCIPEEYRPQKTSMRILRKGITSYISTLENSFIKSSDQTLIIPDISNLKKEGIPICDNESLEKEFKRLTYRRKVLRGLIETDLWDPNTLEIDDFSYPDYEDDVEE